jgi:ribosomal protein S18 acetylase RimI-like enzyme
LEKLAVLPEHRNRGYGRLLVDFAFDEVRKNNGEKISLGIINENLTLKKWYIDYGFIELTVKRYPHLPFNVCLLEKEV